MWFNFINALHSGLDCVKGILSYAQGSHCFRVSKRVAVLAIEAQNDVNQLVILFTIQVSPLYKRKKNTHRNSLIKNPIIVIALCSFITNGQAQLLTPERLQDEVIYRSIEEAISAKEEVYILNLSKQKLINIPPEVFNFKNLNILILKKNRITEVPSEVMSLKYLQEIDLSKNKMENFPKELIVCSNLKRLKLGSNLLEQIPIAIGGFENLEELDLWDNNIHNIPVEISNIQTLKKLDLRLAQFSDEEQKIIQGYIPKSKVYFSNSCDCD